MIMVVRTQRIICMGAEGVGILQHDLALDVVDLFYEHFDVRTPCMEIPQSLRLQIGFDDLDDAEKEVFCCALIECLWQVGADTSQYEQLVGTLDNCEGVLQYAVVLSRSYYEKSRYQKPNRENRKLQGGRENHCFPPETILRTKEATVVMLQ
jgi:hypothetical protein